MQDELMKYFKVLGQIQDIFKNSEDLDTALTSGIQAIIKEIPSDYAILWYAGDSTIEGQKILSPYYWRGDKDFAMYHHMQGESIVGRVYLNQSPEYLLEYEKGADEGIDTDFEGIDIGSVICVPFADNYENLGTIELARRKESQPFDEEMGELLALFAELAANALGENKNIPPVWKFNNCLLSARDITRSFINGDTVTTVLRGVNLDIYEGEFLVILGESGSGKSTFMNIIGGMDKADSGTFSFMGKEMSNSSQDELTIFRRDNIGFIFQSYNLISTFTAAQNIDLIGELVEDHLTSDEVLELVGLSARKKNYPAQLSGGQQQRVSIARALVKKPKMIFADEPTSALDYSTSIEVLSVLENVVKQGTTLVMVTHNEEITKMADRVVRMRNGKTWDVTINKHPCHAEDLVW